MATLSVQLEYALSSSEYVQGQVSVFGREGPYRGIKLDRSRSIEESETSAGPSEPVAVTFIVATMLDASVESK